ncbi:hypothetical protein L9F63_015706, partial [Diploptera punctata]
SSFLTLSSLLRYNLFNLYIQCLDFYVTLNFRTRSINMPESPSGRPKSLKQTHKNLGDELQESCYWRFSGHNIKKIVVRLLMAPSTSEEKKIYNDVDHHDSPLQDSEGYQFELRDLHFMYGKANGSLRSLHHVSRPRTIRTVDMEEEVLAH